MMRALISPSELATALDSAIPPVLFDASWHMPASGRKGAAEFAGKHIPTARFFDIDAIRDMGSDYPHMLPTAPDFAASLGALGVRETDDVVIYDSLGLFSAPRVWWMLRVMGHKGNVRTLNGGLPAWEKAGLPLSSHMAGVTPTIYRAYLQPDLFADWVTVGEAQGVTILDARSAVRFAGTEPEPRAGLRSGHIPTSTNLHYARLLQADGTLKPTAELQKLFAEAGVGDRPIITSCGSGVTACILALGLYEIGREDVRVYDGSWAEWGSRDDLPIAQ